MNTEIQENKELVLFENSKIRRQEYKGEWFYSIVDIIGILIQQENNELARRYWNKTKQRIIKEENNELETICLQLKLPSHKDGNNLGTAIDNTNNLLGNQTWKYKAMGIFTDVENVDHCDFKEITGW